MNADPKARGCRNRTKPSTPSETVKKPQRQQKQLKKYNSDDTHQILQAQMMGTQATTLAVDLTMQLPEDGDISFELGGPVISSKE